VAILAGLIFTCLFIWWVYQPLYLAGLPASLFGRLEKTQRETTIKMAVTMSHTIFADSYVVSI
jgi:hypothetical protein